ncbi:hypothetical protein HDU87_002661 [Geranomyces variabilis]|uniref:PROP1-like PPR domain-containing protein n=1 Tax=Geranomyces variabilis TaxID=109894 RepID=A0AAD5TTK1_9FUNG|nr:hypothetical protein HDU87_002661 [Geranomyces variabilis]
MATLAQSLRSARRPTFCPGCGRDARYLPIQAPRPFAVGSALLDAQQQRRQYNAATKRSGKQARLPFSKPKSRQAGPGDQADGSLVLLNDARRGEATEMEKALDVPVEDADVEDLYSALNEPLASATLIGPGAAASLKLDPDYLRSLQLKFSDAGSKVGHSVEELRNRALELTKQRAPSVADFTQVIHVNGLLKRPVEAQAAFDLIAKSGLKPDLIAHNHLMDAYRRVDDLDKIVEIFQQLETNNLDPDVVSYGIIIDACVRQRDLAAAFRLYERMGKMKIPATQPIFTSLIKGCLQANDPTRAWKTFDYMREKLFSPDAITYSLMIHACSKTQDAERALDLFQEMAGRGLSPTDVTFTALIQACGSRADYYNEAFELLGQMAAEGFIPNLQTYNVLMKAAATQADVTRARLIWNDLMDRVDSEDQDASGGITGSALTPNLRTYMALFGCYSHAIAKARRRKHETPSEGDVDEHQSRQLTLEASEAYGESTPATFQHEEPVTAEPAEPTHAVQLVADAEKAPRLVSTSTHPRELLIEAETTWSYLKRSNAVPITSELLDAYLEVLCSNPTNTKALEKALTHYTTAYIDHAPSGHARNNLLAAVTRSKKAMAEHGARVWADLLEWDAAREAAMEEESAAAANGGSPGGKLHEREKEARRKLEGRGKAVMLKNFIRVVNGLTRIDDLCGALDTLEASLKFRHEGYLPQIHFTDVWALVTRAQDLAEDGKLKTAQRLIELCPRPSAVAADSPATSAAAALNDVRMKLKMKSVGGGWWGWEALGVDDRTLRRAKSRKVNRVQSKKTAKIVKRETKSSWRPAPPADSA